MIKQISQKQWVDILQDDSLTKKLDLDIFQTMYRRPGCKLNCGRIASFLGCKDAIVINSEIAIYAKRIAKKHDINYAERDTQEYKFWDLFFTGFDKGGLFYWVLRPELVGALEETKLTGL